MNDWRFVEDLCRWRLFCVVVRIMEKDVSDFFLSRIDGILCTSLWKSMFGTHGKFQETARVSAVIYGIELCRHRNRWERLKSFAS
jgi:hypothetical protein